MGVLRELINALRQQAEKPLRSPDGRRMPRVGDRRTNPQTLMEEEWSLCRLPDCRCPGVGWHETGRDRLRAPSTARPRFQPVNQPQAEYLRERLG
jgi:hypothetical protein